jgi:hypothetical protein
MEFIKRIGATHLPPGEPAEVLKIYGVPQFPRCPCPKGSTGKHIYSGCHHALAKDSKPSIICPSIISVN